MTMAPKYSELKKKSLSELKQEYDKLAESTVVGLNFIHEEILRREQNKLAREVRILSYVVAFLAVAQVFIAIVK
jgi:hypothetical protein